MIKASLTWLTIDKSVSFNTAVSTSLHRTSSPGRQAKEEGVEVEPSEEKHLSDCLEPAVLADQVPLRQQKL